MKQHPSVSKVLIFKVVPWWQNATELSAVRSRDNTSAEASSSASSRVESSSNFHSVTMARVHHPGAAYLFVDPFLFQQIS